MQIYTFYVQMWMSLIAATVTGKDLLKQTNKKKTATCRHFVHIFFSCQHTKLSALCSNVVAMWRRVAQAPGIYVVADSSQQGATFVEYYQRVGVLTVHKPSPDYSGYLHDLARVFTLLDFSLILVVLKKTHKLQWTWIGFHWIDGLWVRRKEIHLVFYFVFY